MADKRNRVIVRIGGGLGNQLFQYAAARRLAVRNNVPLTLDHISCFPRDVFNRNFLLDKFNIKCDYINNGSSYASFWGRIRRRIQIPQRRQLRVDVDQFIGRDQSGTAPLEQEHWPQAVLR